MFNPLGFFQGLVGPQLISVLLQIGVGYIALLWIFLILWVAKDASHRSESLFFQLISVLLIVLTTPIIGIPLYLLIRPSSSILEREMYDMLHYIVTEGEDTDEEVEEEEITVKTKKGKKDAGHAEKKSMKEERDENITYVDEEEE